MKTELMLIYVAVVSEEKSEVLVPGCLAHSNDSSACSLLNTMASTKQKVLVLFVIEL